MKTRNKALFLTLCAVVLVVATVFGTMAYLTSQDQVVNTFTVGKVAITLDEAPINVDGTSKAGARVQANTYHLIPGHTYTKDPTVHVAADSENSWIFVKVENGIAAYEAATYSGYWTITDQIIANGWTALDGVDGVYYKQYEKKSTAEDLIVFGCFKIAGNANEVEGWSDLSTDNTKITVTAYAVQQDGFATAKDAWSVFGA